jgi:hypothetical protein
MVQGRNCLVAAIEKSTTRKLLSHTLHSEQESDN